MKTAPQNEQRKLRIVRLSAEMSYGALIDRDNREIEITDEMIRKACDQMEDCQVYPFVCIN